MNRCRSATGRPCRCEPVLQVAQNRDMPRISNAIGRQAASDPPNTCAICQRRSPRRRASTPHPRVSMDPQPRRRSAVTVLPSVGGSRQVTVEYVSGSAPGRPDRRRSALSRERRRLITDVAGVPRPSWPTRRSRRSRASPMESAKPSAEQRATVSGQRRCRCLGTVDPCAA